MNRIRIHEFATRKYCLSFDCVLFNEELIDSRKKLEEQPKREINNDIIICK